jgi:YHS domain-containing protein
VIKRETDMRELIVALALLLVVGILAHAGASGPAPSNLSADQPAQPAKVVDPVCGMQVDPAKAAGKSEYKGKTYHFCSDYCKRTFDANPEAVLNKQKKK